MDQNALYDFHHKTVLITGASSGLGEQIARALSAAGARIILAARRIEKLEVLCAELANVKAMRLDVADQQSVAECFQALEQANEKVDVCVNNAGIALLTPLFAEDAQGDFESIIQTNLMGVWYMTQAAALHMRNHGVHGSIINIGSINGDAVPATGGCAYSVSKAAVIHLTKTLVGELSPHKIRINCISPGLFRTPMLNPEADKNIPFIPYGDIAQPSDLDGLVLYLASNAASAYVTGANFTIDGGMSWNGYAW